MCVCVCIFLGVKAITSVYSFHDNCTLIKFESLYTPLAHIPRQNDTERIRENTIREATAINLSLLVDYFSQNSVIITPNPRIRHYCDYTGQ